MAHSSFTKDQSGAVLVEHIVLCSAIVLSGTIVSSNINIGLSTKASVITANISGESSGAYEPASTAASASSSFEDEQTQDQNSKSKKEKKEKKAKKEKKS